MSSRFSRSTEIKTSTLSQENTRPIFFVNTNPYMTYISKIKQLKYKVSSVSIYVRMQFVIQTSATINGTNVCAYAVAVAGAKSSSAKHFFRRVFLIYGVAGEFLYSVINGKSSRCSGYLSSRNTLHKTFLCDKVRKLEFLMHKQIIIKFLYYPSPMPMFMFCTSRLYSRWQSSRLSKMSIIFSSTSYISPVT